MVSVKRFEFLKKTMGGTADAEARISGLYLPIYEWCLSHISPSHTVILGVNGPQGCGKSTLTRLVALMFEMEGVRAAIVSIDDFYLSRAEQVRLAFENPENPYLQNRGYPGTHDIALGSRILATLRKRAGSVLIPVYEKSLFEGRGDRLPKSEWECVSLPLDIVLFDGWMLGFQAVDERGIQDPQLVEINRRLSVYPAWWSQLDALIQLRPRDFRYVIDWRIEAERRMKASGKPAMTEAEARAYVTAFLPAYELYLPTVAASSLPNLVLEIGKDRLPVNPR